MTDGNPYETLLAALPRNTLVLRVNADGTSQVVAKMRGATAEEVGELLGVAQAAIERQIDSLRDHIKGHAGQQGVDAFRRGLHQGRQVQVEDHVIHQRLDTKPKNT